MKKHSFLSREQSWVLAFALGIVVLTAIPYLIAAIQRGGVFTGILLGVEDGNTYIAKMLAGAQGDWLFRSPYTTTEQSGALIYLPYLLLGKLLGPGATHGGLVLLFHVFRALAVVLLCFAVYDFVSYFLHDPGLRRLSLVMITMCSGLGWILLFVAPSTFQWLPLDFYSPEAFGYLAIFSLPHLALARALFLWSLLGYLKIVSVSGSTEDKKVIPSKWSTILLWFALSLVHVIAAVLGVFLMAAHLAIMVIHAFLRTKKIVIPTRQMETVGWAMVSVVPVVAFNAWVYLHDSFLRAWEAQNQILSPNPLHYLAAYGLLLPFAYVGLRRMISAQWLKASFFCSWLILLPFMLYAPVSLNRRLSEGAWVMLVVLALFAFEKDVSKSKHTILPRARNPRELWLFTLTFPSTLILLLGTLQAALIVEPPIFRPYDEIRAFDELRQIAHRGDIVLTSYETGNALAAWDPVRVVIGHGLETDNLKAVQPEVQAVYAEQTAEEARLEILQTYRVNYIFLGPGERSLGSWVPTNEGYFDLVVQVGEYEIYRVQVR